MGLDEAIAAVARQPGALQARITLAAELEKMGVPAASGVWVSTVRGAAARGQFFVALTLCRRHVRGRKQAELLGELAARFGQGHRRDGHRVPPPMPPAKAVEIPDDEDARVELAIRLGRDIHGVGLPDDALMPTIPLFGALEPGEFVALAECFSEALLPAGAALVRQGDVEQAMYLLVQGRARVEQRRPDGSTVSLARIAPPAIVGEISLLTAVPRRASVIVEEPALAWRIDAETLSRLATARPALLGHITTVVKRRLLANVMRQSRLFAGQSSPDAVLRAFAVRSVAPATTVITQGSDPPGLFVVLHGEAEVWAVDDDGDRMRVARLTEGDAFGEVSLLTGEPTTASVLMPEGGALLHLSADAWRGLRGEMPAFEQELTELMDVRRGELADLVRPVEGDFEDVDDTLVELA